MLCGFETPCFQIISDRKLGVRLFYFCLLCLSSASNKSRLSPIWRSYKTVMSFMASTKCGISNHHSSSHTFNRIMISIDLQMWNYKQPGWHHLCWIFFFCMIGTFEFVFHSILSNRAQSISTTNTARNVLLVGFCNCASVLFDAFISNW